MITWTRSKVPTHLFSLPSYATFATEWNQLASRQHLHVAVHTDGVTVFSQWPLQHFFDYIFSFDSIVSNLQYPRECQGGMWIIVRGDGLPCGGESWCQMSISFANHGHLARTLSYHWTVNVALCGEKSTSVLSQVWANNLAFLQSALDSGVVPIRGASRRCMIFCGGDSPWLRRLSGVTTHWMAGSLFSYMTWCKSSATWLQQDVDRTTERDEQLLGLIAPGAKCRPMDIFGVVQSRLLKVPLRRRHLIPCVLHLLIFVGRQVTALVRKLAKSVRPSTRVSVQAILHRSGCHIALQGTAEPDGEETWCLLKVWEDPAPLLGGDMRMHTAVVAMYILLGDMYGTMFEEGALQAPEVAQAFQRWVCPAVRTPYINWMLHDATVTIQAIRPYGLGMFSGDLLEGSNRVLKDIWSSFCDRGGGAGTLVSRRIEMLRQVNERLFLYFEVPRWNGTSRSNLCNAQKLADEVRAYFADEELW